MKCVVDSSNTMGVTGGEETAYPFGAPEFTSILSGVHVSRSFVFCVMFCRSLFVLLVIMFLFFFDLRILITPLVSSNPSLVFLTFYTTCTLEIPYSKRKI